MTPEFKFSEGFPAVPIEPLTDGWGPCYETNLVNTASDGRELVELTGHPSVGIHLDTFHMNIEEGKLGDAIRTAGDKLFHLHGCDSHRGAAGDGHIQWHEVADALRAIQYESYVVFESFKPNGRLAPIARIWRSLAESPDALAKNGIAFLNRELRDQAAVEHK